MSGIVFERVSHAFDGRRVVDSVSLELTERRVGIVGANGSGKSTLARMINGLVEPDSGRVLVDGLDVATQGREVRRRVGFVFTNADTQIVMPTVREDVAFTLRRHRLPRAEADGRVDAALARFGLTELADRPAHRLSGGQKQLLALASVLVGHPAVVVADEPTTLLDARNARRVARHLAALDEQLVVVSHQLELLEDFDRIIVMDGGRVVCDDVPAAALPRYRAIIDADDADETDAGRDAGPDAVERTGR
ncbi:ABC transporter ATP-binding protein [Agromyces mediolanus]|uniref:energy-coupling factor ABC transporter ATP-binding protein n=1 Tax=Agromyces mediolanus TaxID=41986 RepID=UPI0038348540